MGNSNTGPHCCSSAAASCERSLSALAPSQERQSQVGQNSSLLSEGGSSSSQPPTARSSWDFNPIGHDSETLQQLASQLLLSSFSGCGGSRVEDLRRFVKGVALGYRENAFHNLAHAVDGLQAVCWQGSLMPWDMILTAPLRFALAVAAIAVNIGHPGFDNAFLIDAEDEIACCYNDISPLENMHCSQLFEILRKDGHNVLGHLPSEVFRELRRVMVDAILHTDPNCHDEVVEDVRALVRQGFPKITEGFVEGQRRDPILQAFSRALLVSGDLSHQTRPWLTANTWAELLQSEICLQGERELELGLPVSPLPMSKPHRSDLQLQLGSGRVAPLLGAQLRLFPALQPAASHLAENAVRWADELQEALAGGAEASDDDRAKQIRTLLDPSLPLPHLMDDNKRPGRPGMLDAFTSRRDLSKSSRSGRRPSDDLSQRSSVSSKGAEPSHSLVREVRRWREVVVEPDASRRKKDSASSRSQPRKELVLLYVVSNEQPSSDGKGSGGKPVVFRYLDRNDASPDAVAAADLAVSAGERAAAARVDEVLPRARPSLISNQSPESPMSPKSMASAYSNGLPAGFSGEAAEATMAADAVCTDVESEAFNDLLVSLMYGNGAALRADENLSPITGGGSGSNRRSVDTIGLRLSARAGFDHISTKGAMAMFDSIKTYFKSG
eukprot:TRINITY_DN35460_c0_g1_i1.p1 TRINITY_DN35460_c0_g1~~TRINITY_DN35460_c0_g1_i1.p1  ORF type:complete len:669 (+),score=120.41 TRINITY_DN35460_c0_g1_i1:80-2086(+)